MRNQRSWFLIVLKKSFTGTIKYVDFGVNQICSFWRAGRCNRNPCRFLHLDAVQLQPQPQPKHSHFVSSDENSGNNFKTTWRNSKLSSSKIVSAPSSEGVNSESKIFRVTKKQDLRNGGFDCVGEICHKANQKICRYWTTGNCVHSNNCRDPHSWFSGSGFSLLATLDGHDEAVIGVSLPSGSDKLYSGSKDGSVGVWDCISGQDGFILAWKSTPEPNQPVVVATLTGHKLAAICLVVGANWLYSGLNDETIRVWDVKTLQCVHILEGHSSFVTAVLCWDSYLLSGSLDNTLKMWALSENGNLEVVYEVKES